MHLLLLCVCSGKNLTIKVSIPFCLSRLCLATDVKCLHFFSILLILIFRIKKISNLENLKNLDVLDLHGNQVSYSSFPSFSSLPSPSLPSSIHPHIPLSLLFWKSVLKVFWGSCYRWIVRATLWIHWLPKVFSLLMQVPSFSEVNHRWDPGTCLVVTVGTRKTQEHRTHWAERPT